MSKLSKLCPICSRVMKYKSKKALYWARWNKSACKKCSRSSRRKYLTKFSRPCPKCKKVIYYRSYRAWSQCTKQNTKCSSCANSGSNNPFYGKRHTNDDKLQRRIRRLKEIKNAYGGAAYNPAACRYFTRLNKKMKWNGKYATNGGEQILAGYSVDFYDSKRNIVVEYDELFHEKPNVKKRDKKRQEEIIKQIGCNFYRYSKKYSKLYEVTNGETKKTTGRI